MYGWDGVYVYLFFYAGVFAHALLQALEKDADDNEQYACMVTSQRCGGGVFVAVTNFYIYSFYADIPVVL